MIVQVTKNRLKTKEKDEFNENEYKAHVIEFEFSDEYTEDLVKVALFSRDDKTYKVVINNNTCNIPPEVVEQSGICVLGVYAYEVQNEELVIRYSPTPIDLFIAEGSYVPDEDTENSEPITPSEMEQYEQALNAGLVTVNGKIQDIDDAIAQTENLDIDASKSGKTVTIDITKKNGLVKTVQVQDGEKGDTGDEGPTGNGINNITKTSTVGLIDTYTIAYTNGNTTTFNIQNGANGRDGTNGKDGQNRNKSELMGKMDIHQ